jgi:hypothetical protein
MTLGIQKLQGGVPFDVALPNFNSAGIRKPEDVMAYALTPRWPDFAGELIDGPMQPGSGPVFRQFANDNGRFQPKARPFVISFWIRIPSGGGGNVLSLYNPGYQVGVVGGLHSFNISVTETTITMSDVYGSERHDFSRSFDINQQNTGWHHVFITYNHSTTSSLYVDGRDIGWDSASQSASGPGQASEGYLAVGIGGQRKQVQQGLNTVVVYTHLANQYDLCHLGLWQGGGIGGNTNDFYPRFYDPGTSGRMDGTWTAPTGGPGNAYGTAFPYPLIWCELDYSNNNASPIVGAAFASRTETFSFSGAESNIFDQSESIAWQEGVSGAGAISAAP